MADAHRHDYALRGYYLPFEALPVNYFPKLPPPRKDPRVKAPPVVRHRIGEKLWTQRDRVFLNAQALRYYRKVYPCVPVCLIDFERTEVDSLTHEALHPVWQAPLYVPAQIQWSPAQDVLTRFRIERSQDVLVTFPAVVLDACGIDPPEQLYGATLVLIVGDQREPVQYTALSVHQQPRDAWSPLGDILEVAVTAERRVHASHEKHSDLPIDRSNGFTGDYS